MNNNNPFSNLFKSNNNNGGLFGIKTNEGNSLFGNQSQGTTQTTSLFSGPFGLNSGQTLFGTKPLEKKEEIKTNTLFDNNPFNNKNKPLFGFGNNDKSKENEKSEEKSGIFFGSSSNNFNFSSTFSIQNNDNNNNKDNNQKTLFGFNNNNTNIFEDPKNKDKTTENSNSISQPSFGFKIQADNNTTTNTGALFSTQKQENNNGSKKLDGLFSTSNNDTNNNNIKFGNLGASNSDNNKTPLFGSSSVDNNNDKTETTSNFKNLFNQTKNQTNINTRFLFGNPKPNNDNKDDNLGLFNKDNNKKDSLFGEPKIKKDEESKLNFSNNLFKNDNNKSTVMFTPISNKEEENQTKNLGLNNNGTYNPFQPVNETKKTSSDTNMNSNSNNFGNIFNINNNNKEEEKLKPKNNNDSNTLFNNLGDSNNKPLNNLFSPNNQQNVKEIQTNSSIFNNNNNENSLFMGLDKNENEINNISDDNDKNMDLEEEIKEETSSTKSDNINKLWISDNEEIIDDDTDINKKIDYKKIEEKSKNIPNNINDLNLLIIPELSEYYFNKSNPDNYNFNSNSNIKDKSSIEISNKIIEILNEKIEMFNDDEEKKNELINITTIYTYFDAFILHRNDIIYLMKLRDELFYKYLMPIETIIDLDKKNNEKYKTYQDNIESIINNLKHIYFYLTMLDISKANQKMMELNRVYKEILRKKSLGNQTLVFNDLFLNIEKIIKIYNDIYDLKDNFNSKQIISSFNMNLIFQDVKETIFSLQKEILNKHSTNENIKKLFLECQRICGMFAGDMKCIINEYNINNIHLIILGNIFYRFHLNDFIRGLQKCLDTYKKDYDKDNDLVNKIIIRIIKNCDSNQIEIVQELKGNYPFLLRYHMIEILSQNEFLYHIENQERYLKQETFLFYQMLRDSKIPFKYYLNYFLFCPNFEIFIVDSINNVNNLPEDPSEDMRDEGYRRALDYALIYITYKFNNYDNIEELIDEINEIKSEINKKIKYVYSNDILYKINKLCLNKFIEQNLYKYSICCYIDNYNLDKKDYNKLLINQQRNELCAQNNLNFDYPKQFDKVIINFYLKTKNLLNMNTFREIYDNNDKQIYEEYKEYQDLLNIILEKKENLEIDNNALFIINYIEYLLDVIKYNLNKIERNGNNNINIVACTKKFFDNCFPLPKCPSFIWYHILMLIKNVIDDNITLFNNDTFLNDSDNNICEQLFIWEKKLINNLIKIENMKNNKINFDDAQKMYENAVTFMNDITQGLYFNQNIFSISINNNN